MPELKTPAAVRARVREWSLRRAMARASSSSRGTEISRRRRVGRAKEVPADGTDPAPKALVTTIEGNELPTEMLIRQCADRRAWTSAITFLNNTLRAGAHRPGDLVGALHDCTATLPDIAAMRAGAAMRIPGFQHVRGRVGLREDPVEALQRLARGHDDAGWRARIALAIAGSIRIIGEREFTPIDHLRRGDVLAWPEPRTERAAVLLALIAAARNELPAGITFRRAR